VTPPTSSSQIHLQTKYFTNSKIPQLKSNISIIFFKKIETLNISPFFMGDPRGKV